MAILVLGGAGFIGRHVVAALLARRERVVIGSRRPHRRRHANCAVREAHLERLQSPADWYPLLEGIDVVVNCVGILRERGAESYDKVHHLAPAALAGLCARLGLRLVHVSALGLRDDARSGFIRSKLAGERAIAASEADYTIVRPSLLDGEGGFGARWLRRMADLPVHVVPAGATGRIAALDIGDVARAIAVLCVPHAKDVWREVELGGAESWTIAEYLGALRRRRGAARDALRVGIPAWLARLGSHMCDLLHFSPYSFGHFELMRHDNVPRENLLPVLLGRAPTRVPAPHAFANAPTGQETPVPPSPQ
jgi:NADH dehydrogenase